MLYIHEQTETYPCNDRSIRDMNPNVTFPAIITPDIAASFGYFPVTDIDQPTITSTQRLGQGKPHKREDGAWYQTWAITDMEAEEVAAMVAQEKDAKITAAAAACDAALAPLAARFSEYETKTWAKQLAEAQALLADPLMAAASYPTIAGIVAVTGEDAAEFAAAVVKNDEDWTAVSAYCVGMRQRIVAQVKAATTLDEVRAVDMTITLPG